MTARNPDLSGAKPRVIRYERKRLALLGNQRARTHGRYTAAAKAERLARQKEFREEQHLADAEWLLSLTPASTDYVRLVADLDRWIWEHHGEKLARAKDH